MLRRAVISTLRPLVANRTYTVRHGLATGLKRRGGLGFVPRLAAPTAEERFLGSLDLDGRTVYDVGAYEGVFTLFFARRIGPSGRLVTFEPNPHNCARIVENVRLNGFTHVDVRPIALGARPERRTLVYPPGEAAKGTLAREIQAQIRRQPAAAAITVDVDTIDRQIALGLPEPDLVKIDVEGLECEVLDGMAQLMARRRPALYIEMHGADPERKLANATAVAGRLWRAGYTIRHVESGLTIDAAPALPAARRGHLFCTA
jgi:FkbM family methyltransferase